MQCCHRKYKIYPLFVKNSYELFYNYKFFILGIKVLVFLSDFRIKKARGFPVSKTLAKLELLDLILGNEKIISSFIRKRRVLLQSLMAKRLMELKIKWKGFADQQQLKLYKFS